MSIKLSFLGAAQSVTGSRYLVETDGTRIMVDCGLCQERECRQRDWEPFPVPPESIKAVLITHAHLDHCGYLPRLVSQGFHGPIYCTEATADIIKIILLDAAKLMEEDAEFKKKRHEREGRKGVFPEIPLYTQQDAEAVFPLFQPVQYDNNLRVTENIEAVFYNAGHVLGSADIKIILTQKDTQRSILFSGDLGAEKRPIVQDRKDGIEADYVLVESTYGNRSTGTNGDLLNQLADVINATKKAGGNIVIPAFALERAQDILYYINELLLKDRIPHLLVFLDSPMAVNITEIFEKHPELFDEEMREYINRRQSPFRFIDLKLIHSIDESKAINHINGTVIIIAGSGMCTGGRIKHHLVSNISRRSSTILFVGYQAIGTLGRLIVDGVKKVRILGKYYRVKARVVQIHGFSAHADREQLLEWLLRLRRPPKRVFVVHGETESAKSFAELVTDKTGWSAVVPDYKEEVILE
jgi:metallo-beta-lactamase family protein